MMYRRVKVIQKLVLSLFVAMDTVYDCEEFVFYVFAIDAVDECEDCVFAMDECTNEEDFEELQVELVTP